MNLGYNTSLQSLTFRLAFLADLRALPAVLSTIRAPSLEKISIRILPSSDAPTCLEMQHDLIPVECSALDVLLTSERFLRVHSVVFDLAYAVRPEEIWTSLSTRMPLLSSQGRVVVSRDTT